MRKARTTLAITAILMVVTAGFRLSAQDSKAAPNKELTIEELFLKSIELQVMREKAYSEDYDTKMSALDDLDRMINAGSVGDNKAQIEFMLEYLSLEGSLRRVREDRRQVNNFPEVRRRAVSTLGKLGGTQAAKALITVLLGDDEPMVKSEAAYGLGEIGYNDNNEAADALAFAIEREDPNKPDNNFGFAVSLAFEKLAQKTKGIKDPAAFRALIKIAQGNYLKTVRTKALQVLDGMKQYQ